MRWLTSEVVEDEFVQEFRVLACLVQENTKSRNRRIGKIRMRILAAMHLREGG